ncbi:MAG: hypothetical protein HOP11_03710 [Saprospiraceae bacterium]|nr:hypothetical protein [Saprospiraceae bacterium]
MKQIKFSKTLIVTIFSIFLSIQAHAQFELKINPIAALFEVAHINVEKGINEDMSIDLDIIAGSEVLYLTPSFKYYFNPSEKGSNKFYFSAFVPIGSFEDNDFLVGIGFGAGYKFVSKKNVVFEIGTGIGRAFNDYFVPYARFGVGYRFNKK